MDVLVLVPESLAVSKDKKTERGEKKISLFTKLNESLGVNAL